MYRLCVVCCAVIEGLPVVIGAVVMALVVLVLIIVIVLVTLLVYIRRRRRDRTYTVFYCIDVIMSISFNNIQANNYIKK